MMTSSLIDWMNACRRGWVFALKRDFPDLQFSLNGVVDGCHEAAVINEHEIRGGHLQGVMIGRAAYNYPWQSLSDADKSVFNANENAAKTRRQVTSHFYWHFIFTKQCPFVLFKKNSTFAVYFLRAALNSKGKFICMAWLSFWKIGDVLASFSILVRSCMFLWYCCCTVQTYILAQDCFMIDWVIVDSCLLWHTIGFQCIHYQWGSASEGIWRVWKVWR